MGGDRSPEPALSSLSQNLEVAVEAKEAATRNSLVRTLKGDKKDKNTKILLCLQNFCRIPWLLQMGLGRRARHTRLARAARQPLSLKVARLDFYKVSHIKPRRSQPRLFKSLCGDCS